MSRMCETGMGPFRKFQRCMTRIGVQPKKMRKWFLTALRSFAGTVIRLCMMYRFKLFEFYVDLIIELCVV